MKMTLFWCVFLAGCSTAVMTPVAGEDAGPGPGCAVPGQQLCAGACVQIQTDGVHCGGCNNRCPEGLLCRGGVCSDPMMMITCDGVGESLCSGRCADITSDPDNCGGCDRRCAAGESCSNGQCASGDTPCSGLGQQMCDGVCVNVTNDAQNCGGCNNACGGDARCVDGDCTCGVGLTYCGGECVNTQRDVRHCGGCLDPCNAGFDCRSGRCVEETDEICDGQDNDLDGRTDEGEMGMPLTRACDNLCGPGIERCENSRFGGCDAPTPMDELCDEADNDCDGLVDEGVSRTYYEDYDGDGFGDPNLAFSVQACALPDEPTRNGGVYVANGDDCADVDVEIHPEAEEVCDEQDNNCDDDIDENCACAPLGGTRDCGPAEGICIQGSQECTEAGWSPCDGPDFVPPEPRESCNALDDDCDGMVDEGLADDGFEPNDACAMAQRLPNVQEGRPPVRVENATLHHGDPEAAQDQDWYIYTTREAFHLDCLERLLEPQCNFIFEAGLRVPDGAEPDSYVMCLYENGCGGPRFCTNDANGPRYDAENRTWVIRLNAPGTCGLDDNKTFAVQVFYNGGGEAPNACETYDLAFVFGFVEQECAQ